MCWLRAARAASDVFSQSFLPREARALPSVRAVLKRWPKLSKISAAANGQAQSVVMDVTVASSIETALDAAEARFGPVEIVINNAGVTATRPALQQDEADWDKVIDTNLKGVLAGRASRRTTNGRASGEGFDRQCGLDPGPAGCKFRRSLCRLEGRRCADDQGAGAEWARYGIRVNALAPGYF